MSILCPIDYLSSIENLLLFESTMFEDKSFKRRTKKSYYLCQYLHFEVHAWIIMNGVYDKYKGYSFLSIHFGLL